MILVISHMASLGMIIIIRIRNKGARAKIGRIERTNKGVLSHYWGVNTERDALNVSVICLDPKRPKTHPL